MGAPSIPCRPISAAAAALSRSASALARRSRSRSRSASSGIATPSAASRRRASAPSAALGFDRDETAETSRIADAAEDRLEKAALAHRLHDLARARRDEELHEFGAHALAREPRETVARADRGGEALAVEPARGESGREAEEPENAQIILANPRVRFADEAHPSRAEILEAADVVVDRSVGAERQRVDGEIASPRVGGEVASEHHLGPPPVGLDVLAQRRRFERVPVDDDRHRAVRDAGQSDLEARLLARGG